MFKFFKKKTKVDILNLRYKTLLKESINLSKLSLTYSDMKLVEAESILNEIAALKSISTAK